MSRESTVSREAKEFFTSKNTYMYAVGIVGLILVGMALQSLTGILPNYADKIDKCNVTFNKSETARFIWKDGNTVNETILMDGSIMFMLVPHAIFQQMIDLITDLEAWYRDSTSTPSTYPDMSEFEGGPNMDEMIMVELNEHNNYTKTYYMYEEGLIHYDIMAIGMSFKTTSSNNKWGNIYNNEIGVDIYFEPEYFYIMIEMIEQNIIDNGGQPAPSLTIANYMRDVVITSFNLLTNTFGLNPVDKDEITFTFGNFVVDQNGELYDPMDNDRDRYDDFDWYWNFSVNGQDHVMNKSIAIIS